jgi:hypothetical protein
MSTLTELIAPDASLKGVSDRLIARRMVEMKRSLSCSVPDVNEAPPVRAYHALTGKPTTHIPLTSDARQVSAQRYVTLSSWYEPRR